MSKLYIFDMDGTLLPKTTGMLQVAHVTGHTKVCEKLGFPYEESVAFGDSVTDVPLFQSLIHTVSVNGDDAIKNYAKYEYVGADLLEAFRLLMHGCN